MRSNLFFIFLMLAVSGCASWEIIGVENTARHAPYQRRDEGLASLREIIDSNKSEIDLKIYASYSYAALNLGYLAVPPKDVHGYTSDSAPSIINIDKNLLSRRDNRAEAKKNFQYVILNMDKLQGNGLRTRDAMKLQLSYSHYYLALINFSDGEYEAAMNGLDQFDSISQLDGKAKYDSSLLRGRIAAEIQAVFRHEQELMRREERSREVALEESENARRAAAELKKNEKQKMERNLPSNEYVALLQSRNKSKLSYKSAVAFKIVRDFRIDCNMEDWRYLSLASFLLARVDELNRGDSWLESSIDERLGVVRVFDQIVNKNGTKSDFALAFEVSGLGLYTIRPEAVARACNGAFGPIWSTEPF